MIPMQYALRRRMMMAAMASVDISALSITYTGAYTDYGMVTMSDGARYRLLAFTASGTLSIEQPVNCEVCVVGGGANGANATYNGGGDGGAGAYMKNQSVSAYNGGSVVVGAGQGVSSIADVSVNAVSGKNGGTGGGGGTGAGGVGDGISKYPFGDESYSLWTGKPHCGGGGGGAVGSTYGAFERAYDGGNGGTNGGSGNNSTSGGLGSSGSGGSGGPYGGAAGADASSMELASGDNATYYGSGGGGGAQYHYVYSGSTHDTVSNGGSGYQGIVYMRIPEEPAAYISDLPLGALINVGTDDGAGTPNYEIADKNNLVSGGVVLVRKNIHSKSAFGSSSAYPGDTLDNTMTSIYNSLPEKLQSKIMDATFALEGSGSITRKVFALTYTMVGFGANNGTTEGKALQLYTSNANRIKKYSGSADVWWLSSRYLTSNGFFSSRAVITGGTTGSNDPSNSYGVVPAFVIPSTTPYNPTPNTDGSYNLIL